MIGLLSSSTMTDADFILTTGMKKHQLATVVRQMTLNQALDYRRNIQLAATSYFTRHPQEVMRKERFLVVCATIEKWCRQAYFAYYMPKIQRLHPEWNRQTVKIEVKKEWEALVRKNSY